MTQSVHKQSINAAVVNVSGRQRMLSQRVAMFCMRLVGSRDPVERQSLRQTLQGLVTLMERSHQGLINGDEALHLPGNPSPAVWAMYFEAPHRVNQRMKDFLSAACHLIAEPDAALGADNAHLEAVVTAASRDLLRALDAIVAQYQRESEAEQFAIEAHQLALHRQSCAAAAAAGAKAAQLQQTLDELNHTQAQLLQTEKMSSLGLLVGGVAHEINNPINFIHSNLPFLKRYAGALLEIVSLYQKHYPQSSPEIQSFAQAADLPFLQEDLPKILDSMDIGTGRIRQMVASLRNFSRVDEAELKAVDVHEGIRNTLLLLRYRLKANEHRPAIQVNEDYGVLPPVECYPSQLNQCFMNLLANAIDAIDEAYMLNDYVKAAGVNLGPAIDIKTLMVNDAQVKILISDTGIGIPEPLRQRILEPFFTTKPAGKGTGMGLSISYKIIAERHSGQLHFCSDVGKGTAWTIQIPVRQQQLVDTVSA